ncbi:TRL domain-containing protein [Thermodesulfobacteriota bacterium]
MFKSFNKFLCPLLFAVIIFSALLSGCVYTKVIVPLDIDTSQTQLGEKIGKSHLYSIAWLFTWGDAGTAAAAENGGIKTIKHLDTEYFLIFFGLFYRQTTIAYGD